MFGNTEKIDRFALILKGKIGIFYPDRDAIKTANKTPGRVVLCAETDIENKKKKIAALGDKHK